MYPSKVYTPRELENIPYVQVMIKCSQLTVPCVRITGYFNKEDIRYVLRQIFPSALCVEHEPAAYYGRPFAVCRMIMNTIRVYKDLCISISTDGETTCVFVVFGDQYGLIEVSGSGNAVTKDALYLALNQLNTVESLV